MTLHRTILIMLGILLATPALSTAETKSDKPKSSDKKTDKAKEPKKIPPPLKFYLGRRIAYTMHHIHSAWLVRASREKEERTSVLIRELKIKPGMIVADMGCGIGYHALMLSKLVGEKGKVYAVDIQKRMLIKMAARIKKLGGKNIIPIHNTLIDTKLPPNSCDLILMVDVYHEFSHPVHMLKSLHKALRKNGRIALVEYRAEDKSVPIRPDHKMSKKQILKEYTANNFKLTASYDKLPWQHLMFFQKVEHKKQKDEKQKDKKETAKDTKDKK